MIVDIFIPCYIDQIYPDTGKNLVKVLQKLGCGVNYNIEQTCCGQPAFNAGFWDHCKEVAQKFITDFPNDRYIVTPSASCVGMVRNYYPEMFHNSSLHNEYKQVQKNIFEFSDFMINILKKEDTGASLNAKAVFIDSCAGLRECRIKEEPRKLLRTVKGLELVELKKPEICCGFGGTFSVKNEAISVAMAKDKVQDAMDSGAEILISTDSSCIMHLESYIRKQNLPLRTMHLVDVLSQGI